MRRSWRPLLQPPEQRSFRISMEYIGSTRAGELRRMPERAIRYSVRQFALMGYESMLPIARG
jgi:hypothetical protein